MIPMKDMVPQLKREPIMIEPRQVRVVAQRVDPFDMQTTVDLIEQERKRKERRNNDTLMHTLIYSVWRRR